MKTSEIPDPPALRMLRRIVNAYQTRLEALACPLPIWPEGTKGIFFPPVTSKKPGGGNVWEIKTTRETRPEFLEWAKGKPQQHHEALALDKKLSVLKRAVERAEAREWEAALAFACNAILHPDELPLIFREAFAQLSRKESAKTGPFRRRAAIAMIRGVLATWPNCKPKPRHVHEALGTGDFRSMNFEGAKLYFHRQSGELIIQIERQGRPATASRQPLNSTFRGWCTAAAKV